MKFKTILPTLFILIMVLSNGINAQENTMVLPKNQTIAVVNKGSELKQAPLAATANVLDRAHINWDVELKNYGAFNHITSVSSDEFMVLKNAANEKALKLRSEGVETSTTRGASDTPVMQNNFRGNIQGSSVPPDNSFAVSKNGFIVSGINSNVIFTIPNGDITFEQGLPDFFTLLNLGTRMYDPRVIYDTEQDRFIFMCLHGSTPETTQLCIAFSLTEDPNGDWNYYKIDGNPLEDANWFDYPNIAISQDDYYIAGLMRNSSGNWQYSVLYQIDKMDGYNGEELTYKHYHELVDADGEPSFNLVPTPSGWSNLIGPGMYFVSNEELGGNTYNFYYTTESVNNNPELVAQQIVGLETELAPYGRQLGTNQVLNTFDSRIWSAMYANGYIHMGSHVMTDGGTSGLFYGRLDIANQTVDADIYTEENRDYGFPSFTTFGQSEDEAKVLVNYLVSGPDIYPSQEVMVCEGVGSEFDWSEPIRLKTGASFVDVLQDNLERWGDYSTSCRRFTDDRIENWVVGCFGEAGSYGTWLGQFGSLAQEGMFFADFSAVSSVTAAATDVQFTDLTVGGATSWIWSFEGGLPATSNEQNPIVQYAENGSYDVSLIVSDGTQFDTISRPDFITVREPVIAPDAAFTSDKTTVYTGDTARYMDMSLNNPTQYAWKFFGGEPEESTDPIVDVTYPNKGKFIVTLQVKNVAGADAVLKPGYMTVLERTQPVADFTADMTEIDPGDTVQFADLSDGGPTTWEWTFQGGEPEISTLKNPLVTYDAEGIYDVTLNASNEAGEGSVSKEAYIVVGDPSSVSESASIMPSYILSPNPATIGDRVTLAFELQSKLNLEFKIVHQDGRLVKTLYNSKVKSGQNELSFNAEMLNKGMYFLLISDDENRRQAIPFIIAR